LALEEVHVRRAAFGRVAAGEREHLLRHVQAEDRAGRADALSRKDHVQAAAALVEFGAAAAIAPARAAGCRLRVPGANLLAQLEIRHRTAPFRSARIR